MRITFLESEPDEQDWLARELLADAEIDNIRAFLAGALINLVR